MSKNCRKHGVATKWTYLWGIGVGMSSLVWGADGCPPPNYRHESRPLAMILSGDTSPIFKSAATFDVRGAEFLEVTVDGGGLYVENKAGEVGLPINILRVTVDLSEELAQPACRPLTLFPGHRVLWTKWPTEVQQLINDRQSNARQPINAQIKVEIYR